MNEDELDDLLKQGEVKETEGLLARVEREKEWERELRLKYAFDELNVQPRDFHFETGKFEKWDAHPHCPPPEMYWEWYAQRVIRVANLIVEDGWKGDLDKLEVNAMNGKIAKGLLSHALEGNEKSLAKKIKKAVMRVEDEDGQDTKAWLVVRIVQLLRDPPSTKVEDEGECQVNESHVVDTTDDSSRKKRWVWQEVAKVLSHMVDIGDEYTGPDKLAIRIGCSSNTVRKAIRKVPRLKAWTHEAKKAKSHGFNDIDQKTHAQTREVGPAVAVEEMEEAEMDFFKLVKEAEKDQREELLRLKALMLDNPEGFCFWVQQLKDDRSDHA
ncbi:hypothetical protein DTL21_28360 [Bremerella cremea]|uniref:Uncharacterized protein n=1 Tax=Blastopirellula marina TaxID=124 RepID=A0A2S8F8M6_9BACT|nr:MULTISPECIES: hypothetical protein [Pirellulaceae]PQO28516.1 hypothetical protein C5Y83_28310 [Blastopirellula marina]RCS41886.1 hypothetical protein DTL21_28360 [Bremerella cremea]